MPDTGERVGGRRRGGDGGERVGVFCVDRTSALVFGAGSRLWRLVGDVLVALDAPHVQVARDQDGFVPSWLGREWGDRLFADLGDLVVVARPLVPRGPDLQPVGVYRARTTAAATWSRAGEHVSVYDTPLATPLLAFAQACTVSGGYTLTTLRPPAPGDVPSPVAARRLMVRSGLLRPRPAAGGRHPARPGAAAPRNPAPVSRSHT